MNIDIYSDRAKQAIQSAQSLALARRHQQLALEHILKVLLEERDGLTRAPKSLPPWLFYDERGSALFEAITALPEYYLTRDEAQEKGLQGKAEFIIGKQRNGPTGIVELYFRKECARFESYSERVEH